MRQKIKCLAPTKKGTLCQASKLHCEFHKEWHKLTEAEQYRLMSEIKAAELLNEYFDAAPETKETRRA